MTDHLERENKYVVPPDFVIPPLPGVKSGSDEAQVDQLSATYFDSADLRLTRAHITLRHRSGGRDAGWHLKLPVGPGAREEIQWPAKMTDGVPPDLVELVGSHLRGEPLKPVARIDSSRTRWVARDDAGTSLAEVADDRIIGHTLGSTTSTERWREIEVELLDGDESWLQRVDQELAASGATPGASSKVEHVLADRLADGARDRRPSGHRPHGSAAEVLRAYVAAQGAAILANDPAVRKDTGDGVHKMRVAIRRMRSTLRTFCRDLATERTARLDRELKWLAGRLGDVRDKEVQIARFSVNLAELPSDLVLGPVQARVDRKLTPDYHKARRRLLNALSSERYHALLDELDSFTEDLARGSHHRRPADPELRRQVAKAERTLRRRIRQARRTPPGTERDLAQHRARKAAKRLRYAAEASRPIYGRAAKKLAKEAESIQEVLGDRQDAVVARGILRELAVAAHGAPDEASFTFGLLLGEERGRATLADREIAERWSDGVPKKYRL